MLVVCVMADALASANTPKSGEKPTGNVPQYNESSTESSNPLVDSISRKKTATHLSSLFRNIEAPKATPQLSNSIQGTLHTPTDSCESVGAPLLSSPQQASPDFSKSMEGILCKFCISLLQYCYNSLMNSSSYQFGVTSPRETDFSLRDLQKAGGPYNYKISPATPTLLECPFETLFSSVVDCLVSAAYFLVSSKNDSVVSFCRSFNAILAHPTVSARVHRRLLELIQSIDPLKLSGKNLKMFS